MKSVLIVLLSVAVVAFGQMEGPVKGPFTYNQEDGQVLPPQELPNQQRVLIPTLTRKVPEVSGRNFKPFRPEIETVQTDEEPEVADDLLKDPEINIPTLLRKKPLPEESEVPEKQFDGRFNFPSNRINIEQPRRTPFEVKDRFNNRNTGDVFLNTRDRFPGNTNTGFNTNRNRFESNTNTGFNTNRNTGINTNRNRFNDEGFNQGNRFDSNQGNRFDNTNDGFGVKRVNTEKINGGLLRPNRFDGNTERFNLDNNVILRNNEKFVDGCVDPVTGIRHC